MKQRCPLRPDGTLKPDFKLHIETWRHDQGTVRIFNEAFGHLKLAELSPVHVKQLRAELEQTRSGVTVSKYLYLLNSAMNEAVEDRLIRQSPMPRLRAVRSKPVPRRSTPPRTASRSSAICPLRLTSTPARRSPAARSTICSARG